MLKEYIDYHEKSRLKEARGDRLEKIQDVQDEHHTYDIVEKLGMASDSVKVQAVLDACNHEMKKRLFRIYFDDFLI